MGTQPSWKLQIGAQPADGGIYFRVWAANARHVEVVLYDDEYESGLVPLEPQGNGYFASFVPHIAPDTRYMFRIDGGAPRPDPASRYQPDGVHGASQAVDPGAFVWADANWRGRPLDDLVIYEVHIGTATDAGTFAALIERLPDLQALGVTAIEIMPVADFPGERNWGYDGVNLFAPARTYGGPDSLRALVDAAHAHGLAVLLDVVYNHLGPDGNYLREFSRDYFTTRHSTPWGDALNLDGPNSAPVRAFFIANACHWAHEYHADGLRFDATHALQDTSTVHILAELAETLRATLPPNRHFVLIAEDDRNEPQLLLPRTEGGANIDAVWADDFHHQLRVALTGEREGYYTDYSGNTEDLAKTLRQGWFYTGQLSAYAGRTRGSLPDRLVPGQFVHCVQNHDQIGNRALGDRLNHLIGLDAYRAASALLLLGPYTPLLFMGQEWAASAPFQYFTDHQEELGRLVTEGRRAEFARFTAFAGSEVPDPQARETFLRSKLDWGERATAPHAGVLALYHDALALRHSQPALRARDRAGIAAEPLGADAIALRRGGPAPTDTLLLVVNLRGETVVNLAAQPVTAAPDGHAWAVLLDTEDTRYGGRNPSAFDSEAGTLRFAGPGAVLLAVV